MTTPAVGSSATPTLAKRVKKARGEFICPRCKTPVSVGNQIGLVQGTGWCHIECVLGKKPPMIGWHSGR